VNIDELRQITAWLEAAGVLSLEIRRPGAALRLTLASRAGATGPGRDVSGVPAASAAPNGPCHMVTAPAVGVFLAAHPMRPAAFVRPGEPVRGGNILGLLRIGRVYLPVATAQAGVVVRTLAEPGTLVDFGTPLFEIRPAPPASAA
jgi:biotin carboxyl carrier protein